MAGPPISRSPDSADSASPFIPPRVAVIARSPVAGGRIDEVGEDLGDLPLGAEAGDAGVAGVVGDSCGDVPEFDVAVLGVSAQQRERLATRRSPRAHTWLPHVVRRCRRNRADSRRGRRLNHPTGLGCSSQLK